MSAARDPRFVQKAFASIAGRYVLTNHVLSLGTDVWWRRLVSRRIAEEAPGVLLDLATGSGDLAQAIRRRRPATQIIGADFCLPMLKEARKRRLPNLIVADALQLPFGDSTFDAVSVAFGLRNMISWEDAAREVRRVLRPGGRLYILDFSLPRWRMIRKPYAVYLHRILPWVAGKLTGQGHAYRYLATSIDAFPSGKAMCELLDSCGYREAEATPLSLGIASLYTATKPHGTV